ncbi:MAG: hypothetical protein NZ553_12710 [Caldilinea sp.]|nr:hypothetical protein [Caldilinea sp.]MDW8441329.1 hypothetical protein [Caldilineaceae bacterium]
MLHVGGVDIGKRCVADVGGKAGEGKWIVATVLGLKSLRRASR